MIIASPARLLDVAWVATHLRAEDAQEVATATGKDPAVAVVESFGLPGECYTARLSPVAEPFLVFGVLTNGIVWMLATDEIKKAPKGVFKQARAWLDAWNEDHPRLFNRVDLRNHLHLRWLTLLGFELGAIEDVNGFPFQHVKREQRRTHV